jgi:hypothetical protein
VANGGTLMEYQLGVGLRSGLGQDPFTIGFDPTLDFGNIPDVTPVYTTGFDPTLNVGNLPDVATAATSSVPTTAVSNIAAPFTAIANAFTAAVKGLTGGSSVHFNLGGTAGPAGTAGCASTDCPTRPSPNSPVVICQPCVAASGFAGFFDSPYFWPVVGIGVFAILLSKRR